MKLHANARTCPKSRRLLVDRIRRGLVAVGGCRGRRSQRANCPQVGCQEARAHHGGGAPDVRPGQRTTWRQGSLRLGVRSCLRRRRHSPRLCRGPRRRARQHRRGFPGASSELVFIARGACRGGLSITQGKAFDPDGESGEDEETRIANGTEPSREVPTQRHTASA
jgi:hypothetical protein